jgi:hypothetical protein
VFSAPSRCVFSFCFISRLVLHSYDFHFFFNTIRLRNLLQFLRHQYLYTMTDSIKIKKFWGDQPDEDPEEFIDDMEFLAESWTTGGDNTKLAKNCIRAFRLYLHRDGDAQHWWGFILRADDKKDWEQIKTKFLTRYKVSEGPAHRFDLINEILSINQGTESISDYVKKVERFSKRVPEAELSILAFAFVKGMSNVKAKHEVSFEIRRSNISSLSDIIGLVKASYRDLGAPDPFKSRALPVDTVQLSRVRPRHRRPRLRDE